MKSKGVLLSAPVELEFQQEPMNVNLINCNIPRPCGLLLCRRSWWRQNHSGLFLLYQTYAHSSLWAFSNKGGKKSLLWMWPYTDNSPVLWWSKIHQGLILLDSPWLDVISVPGAAWHPLCLHRYLSCTVRNHAKPCKQLKRASFGLCFRKPHYLVRMWGYQDLLISLTWPPKGDKRLIRKVSMILREKGGL